MKKDRLLLSVLVGFLLSFCSAGDVSFHRTLQPEQAAQVAGKIEVSIPRYPHTELDVRTVQLAPLGSLQTTPLTGADLSTGFFSFWPFSLPGVIAVSLRQVPHKRYLSFIYPSHNFW